MDFDLEEGRGPAEGLVRRHVNGANGDQTDVPLVPEKDISVEEAFEGKVVPEWWQQITVRGVVVSVLLSFLLSIIVMKLNLTTGVIPSLNVSAGLLGFFLIKSYTKVLDRFNFLKVPFTRQENTVIQTCVVSATGIAFSGGFGSYLFAMGPKVYEQSKDVAANTPDTVKDLSIGWIIGFLFLVSFIGLFSVVALRKIMIIDYKLTFPSGTATAVLINGFHTPDGAKIARNQVKYLSKFFTFSFLWSFFQWFYTGGEDCGFSQFPTLGLKARDNMFYFDFSLTYVGAGMICPYIVNVSLFIGAILSWGVMWPLLKTKEGEWYPAGLRPSSMKGLNGYKVFIAISLILGDGLYNFVKIFYITCKAMYTQYKKRQAQTSVAPDGAMAEANETFDDKKRREYFLKDSIPGWMAFTGYVCLAVLSVAVVPRIFPPLKWYFIVLCYVLAPVVGFCNAYGCGLTDWSLASTYGKLAIFIFGAWAGKEDGGVLAGLAACGVMMSIVSTAADLTQDFKTGYLTLSSPRTMFVAQVIGTAMGCIIGPSTFWLFYKAFPLGDPTGEYKVPYGITYRNMAVLGVEGFGALPHNCLYLCYGFFAFAIIMNLIRDRVPARVAKYLPLPMAMAIPFYIGAYFAVDMLIGSAIVFVWQFLNKTSADRYSASVASGLLCGDGLWTLPSSILALAKVNPPICMKFLSRAANIKVDNFLAS